MANKIKVARATTRQNLPHILDYGELGYVKNSQLLVGNGDGTEFAVNDWNNLINRPTGDFVSIIASDNLAPFTPVAVDENGHAVVADKGSELRARVYGFTRSSAYSGFSVSLQIGGNITNPAWFLTAGTTYFLGTAGDLVPSTAGFIATDIIAPLGIALDAHTLALNIEMGYLPGVTSMNGRAGAITVTKADVGLANVENTKLSTWIGTTNISIVGVITSGTWNGNTITVDRGGTGLTAPGAANTLLGVAADGQHLEYKELVAGDGISFTYDAGKITVSSTGATSKAEFYSTVPITEEVLNFLTLSGAGACRFDVVLYTEDMHNVRFETLLVAVGADDTITWNSITTQSIGDTSAIQPVVSTLNFNIGLGFTVDSGSWMFSISTYPVTRPGYVVSATTPTGTTSIAKPQPQFNTLIQTDEVLNYLTIAHSLACRFDVIYYTEDRANVRFETISATIGANDTVSWNAITTHELGDTSGITSIISADAMKIVYGFGITSGSWKVSVVPFVTALPGQEPTYTALPI
jgi:hypothetical protein